MDLWGPFERAGHIPILLGTERRDISARRACCLLTGKNILGERLTCSKALETQGNSNNQGLGASRCWHSQSCEILQPLQGKEMILWPWGAEVINPRNCMGAYAHSCSPTSPIPSFSSAPSSYRPTEGQAIGNLSPYCLWKYSGRVFFFLSNRLRLGPYPSCPLGPDI